MKSGTLPPITRWVKMMDFCINDQNLCQNEEFCIQNEEFCIQNEEFCIQNEEFCSLDLSGNSLVKPAEGQFFIEYIYINLQMKPFFSLTWRHFAQKSKRKFVFENWCFWGDQVSAMLRTVERACGCPIIRGRVVVLGSTVRIARRISQKERVATPAK